MARWYGTLCGVGKPGALHTQGEGAGKLCVAALDSIRHSNTDLHKHIVAQHIQVRDVADQCKPGLRVQTDAQVLNQQPDRQQGQSRQGQLPHYGDGGSNHRHLRIAVEQSL